MSELAVQPSTPTAPGAAWPATESGVGAIVLRFARTPTERDVIDEWVDRVSPTTAEVTSLDADAPIPEDAWAHDAARVVPVRVAWPAPERGRSSWRDALAAANAHIPLPRAQARLVQDQPGRAVVVVAESASVGDLRERFEAETSGTGSFADFVRRQAVLALERAERSVLRGRYKVPQLVLEEVRDGAGFRAGAQRIAGQTGQRLDDVIRQATDDLSEMAAAHSRLAVDTFARFGRFLMRAYSVSVDPDRLEELRALNRTHSLVFLPNHRSYLDPFVVRATLLGNGFPANHCFAGSNMAWWPMGEWTRRTGNIILRRSIGDDPVYKFVLRTYLGYLVSKRLNLEWYIEGGRTRTGKLRPPRYGLLTYLVDAVEALEEDHDVYLVPLSIVYDGLPEVVSLTAEQQGATKKPEGISWLLNYPRSTGKGFGEIHLGIGEPFSLRRALGAHGSGEPRRHRVEKVAFEVCHRINQATPVTPSALVTLALLGVDDRALTLGEVGAVVEPFLQYFERRKIAVTSDLTQGGELRHALDQLAGMGVLVRFDGGTEPVWGISPDRHLEAAFYRNSIVHLLIDRAIVELVLAAAADGRIRLEDDAFVEAQRLRDLFKFEFFFPEKAEFREVLAAELSLIDPDWARRLGDPEYARRVLADASPHLAHRALHSFVESYAVVAEQLAARPPAEPLDEKAFVTECFGVARQRRLQQRLRSSDSISTEVLRTALRTAAHRDLLGPGGEELAQRRRAFATQLSELLGRLDRMRELATMDALNATAAAR
jgi:glycerol-3-phosphate O-acyltransferase